MKKFYILAAIITILYMARGAVIDLMHPPRDIADNAIDTLVQDTTRVQILPQNRELYLGVEDELIICLAYVEEFRAQSYWDGGVWTIGYGSTIHIDGSRVRSGETISMLDAQKHVRSHLRKYVFPYIDKYVQRPLSRQEILGTSMFIYNIGAGNFRKSDFLQAVNEGQPPVECARRMTEFTRASGRFAPGLLKREWVQGAIYCGYLTHFDLLDFTPGGLYNFGVDEYYQSTTRSWDGYYNPKYSPEDIKDFRIKSASSKLKVFDII